MATIYCSTSGSDTSPYDTKAKAATKLDTALGAASAGDTVLLESSYVETVSAAKTFTIPAGVSVIAINYSTDKRQPMADAGGYIGRTSGSSYALTVVFGSGAYLYGVIRRPSDPGDLNHGYRPRDTDGGGAAWWDFARGAKDAQGMIKTFLIIPVMVEG